MQQSINHIIAMLQVCVLVVYEEPVCGIPSYIRNLQTLKKLFLGRRVIYTRSQDEKTHQI